MITNKVLILLSTFNGEKYLREQLNSLSSQIGVEMYYLIRDDGSKDATIKILCEFSLRESNVELIFEKNIGCVNSYKTLLTLASKYCDTIDYFAFCDQDDIWLKEKLSTAIAQLKKMPSNKPAMYCSNLYLINEVGNSIGEMHSRESIRFTKGSSLVESIATGCTMVFNRKTIVTFNDNQPQYMTFHDLWIYHMCMFLGEIFYDDVPQILYRQHKNNVIGSKATYITRWKSRFKSFRTLSRQHFREWEAQEILRLYNQYLSQEDKKLIGIVANYKRNLFSRLKFIFPPKYSNLNMSELELNVWLKIRIVFGIV